MADEQAEGLLLLQKQRRRRLDAKMAQQGTPPPLITAPDHEKWRPVFESLSPNVQLSTDDVSRWAADKVRKTDDGIDFGSGHVEKWNEPTRKAWLAMESKFKGDVKEIPRRVYSAFRDDETAAHFRENPAISPLDVVSIPGKVAAGTLTASMPAGVLPEGATERVMKGESHFAQELVNAPWVSDSKFATIPAAVIGTGLEMVVDPLTYAGAGAAKKALDVIPGEAAAITRTPAMRVMAILEKKSVDMTAEEQALLMEHARVLTKDGVEGRITRLTPAGDVTIKTADGEVIETMLTKITKPKGTIAPKGDAAAAITEPAAAAEDAGGTVFADGAPEAGGNVVSALTRAVSIPKGVRGAVARMAAKMPGPWKKAALTVTSTPAAAINGDLDALVRQAQVNESIAANKAFQFRRRSEVALEGAPAADRLDYWRYLEDQRRAFPAGLVDPEAKQVADDFLRWETENIGEQVALKIASPEEAALRRHGFLQRAYTREFEDDYVRTQIHAGHRVNEQIIRKDAPKVVIKAPQAEVEAALNVGGSGRGAVTYVHEINGKTLVQYESGAEVLRDTFAQRFPGRVDRVIDEATEAERVLWGEMRDPGERMAATAEAMSARTTAGRFLSDVKARFGVTSSHPNAMYMGDSEGFGPLRGTYLPKDIGELITAKLERIDEVTAAVLGAARGVKKHLVRTPAGTFRNWHSNTLKFSIPLEVSPVWNPEEIPTWVDALTQIRNYRATGKPSEMVEAAIRRGWDPRGVLHADLDMLDEMIAGLGSASRAPGTARKAEAFMDAIFSPAYLEGKAITGQPIHKALAAGARGTLGGAQRAVVSAMRGEGALGVASETAIGFAAGAGGGEVAARLQTIYDLADPALQLTGFLKQARVKGNLDEAWREVMLYTQDYKNLPSWVTMASGRTGPKMVRGIATLVGPPFLAFPYNDARILGNTVANKPGHALLMAMQGRMARGGAVGAMVGRGLWTPEQAAEFEKAYPQGTPVPLGGGDAFVVDTSEYEFDPLQPWKQTYLYAPTFGPTVSAGQKFMAGVAAERGKDYSARDITGRQFLRPEERASPEAGGVREAVASMGGSMAPLGWGVMAVGDTIEGRKSFFGNEQPGELAAARLLFGLRGGQFIPTPAGGFVPGAPGEVPTVKQVEAGAKYEIDRIRTQMQVAIKDVARKIGEERAQAMAPRLESEFYREAADIAEKAIRRGADPGLFTSDERLRAALLERAAVPADGGPPR